MEIILLQDVSNLGSVGALVKVAPGYARNFLLPKLMAREANSKNKRQLEHDKRVAGFLAAKNKAKAEALKAKIAGLKLSIARKVGDQDKLFGSVTAHDVHEAMRAKGVEIDRHKVELREPIKALGDYDIEVRLTSEVKTQVKLSVVAE
jgi:large subunit ribosomal protein L9